MTDEAKARHSTDPIELWRQWNDMTSQVWLGALRGNKAKGAEPPSLYQSWTNAVGNWQETAKVNPAIATSVREVWKLWFDATMGVWRKAAEVGGDPLGLSKQWLKLMEQMQEQVQSGEVLPVDPFTFFRKWYEATSEQWSKVIEEIISSPQFVEATGPFIESYLSLMRAFRHASEEYFRSLQLPTLADIAHVAELVVSLEEKVDKVEDALEVLEDKYSKLATAEAVSGLEGRLEQAYTSTTARVGDVEKQVERGQAETVKAVNKLEHQLTHVQKAAAEAVEGLGKRVGQGEAATTARLGEVDLRVERGQAEAVKAVDRLEQQLAQMQTATVAAAEELGKRVEQGEGSTAAKLGELDQRLAQGEAVTAAKLEDLGRRLEQGDTSTATRLGELDQRLGQGEAATAAKLEELGRRLEQADTSTASRFGELNQRLEQGQAETVRTVNALEKQLTQVQDATTGVVEGLQQRLNQVEDKLDRVLAFLEKTGSSGEAEAHETANGETHKTRKRGSKKTSEVAAEPESQPE